MSIVSIYVGNLPYATRPEDLKEIFSRYGRVSRATVIMDRETNRPRGFAFVEMACQTEADAAVAALAGSEFQGRPLTVNCARNNVVRGAGNTSQAAKPCAKPQGNAGDEPGRKEVPPSPSRGYHNNLSGQ